MDTGIYRQIDAWVETSPADNTESADPNAMDTGIDRQIDAWVGTSPADNTESADPDVIDTGIDRQMPGLELVLQILMPYRLERQKDEIVEKQKWKLKRFPKVQ